MNFTEQANPPSPSASPGEERAARPGLSRPLLSGILVLAFLFVLMPFLFWRATWFGQPLGDDEITRYLGDREHPRKAQHALSEISRRLSGDSSGRAAARRWYPEVIALASSEHAELRLTAAWVMGQDNSSGDFRVALQRLLVDPNPMVRRNAALSLVRFRDAQGHDEIHAMLDPYIEKAGVQGTLRERLRPGDSVNPGTLLARIESGRDTIEVRTQVPGTLERWLVADNSGVAPGTAIAAIAPSPEELWEGLRALFLIGQKSDLALVENLAGSRAGVPEYIRKQAELTARAIRNRNPQ